MTAVDRKNQSVVALKATLAQRLLAGTPYLALLISAWAVFSETTDDPFITFRYAANLCSGYGPVYNIGERVEGFTSWLHLLVCSLLLTLLPGLGILLKAKLLSLLCGLLVLFQTGRFATRLHCAPLTVWAVQMFLACNINFAIASVNGLETTLFTAVLLAAVSAFYAELEHGYGILSGGILFLACFTRPETLLYAAILIGVRLFWWRHKELPRNFFWLWLLCFVVPMALFLIFRLIYYGYPFPNTYYAKAVDWKDGLANGWRYLQRPFLPNGVASVHSPWQTIWIIGYWLLALSGVTIRRREPATLLLGLLAMGNILFILKVGGDWMNGCRFLVPVLPYITLLQAQGVAGIVQSRRPGRRRQVGLCIAAPALLALSAGYTGFTLGTWMRRGSPLEDNALLAACNHPYAGTWVTIGQFFRSEMRPGISIAYSEAGYAAYINRDKRFVDTFGLTDREIAHVQGVERCQYGVVTMFWNPPNDPVQKILRRRAPDYIIIGSVAMPQPMPQRLMQDYELMPIPDKWKDSLEKTRFGFYQRRPVQGALPPPDAPSGGALHPLMPGVWSYFR